jgi:ketosteroid isomerase-like protein
MKLLTTLTLILALSTLTAAHVGVGSAWLEAVDGGRPDQFPAPSTTPSSPDQAASNDAASVEAWLKGYDAAFMAKDLDRLAAFYHPDTTFYEGGGINNGWADYRDRHLGPELKAFTNMQFGHSDTKVTVLPGGQSAYATSRYTIKAKMGEREIDAEGLETLLLIRTADGWKIRHSHTSSRPRRPAQ